MWHHVTVISDFKFTITLTVELLYSSPCAWISSRSHLELCHSIYSLWSSWLKMSRLSCDSESRKNSLAAL